MFRLLHVPRVNSILQSLMMKDTFCHKSLLTFLISRDFHRLSEGFSKLTRSFMHDGLKLFNVSNKWHCSESLDFKYISRLFLVFQLLTLNKWAGLLGYLFFEVGLSGHQYGRHKQILTLWRLVSTKRSY